MTGRTSTAVSTVSMTVGLERAMAQLGRAGVSVLELEARASAVVRGRALAKANGPAETDRSGDAIWSVAHAIDAVLRENA